MYLIEFGIPEAMWHLQVNDFAAIVTMDAHGNSLHADVEKSHGRGIGRALPRGSEACRGQAVCYNNRLAAR